MNYLDCLVMNAGLNAVNAHGMKARFSYAVARNKRLLEPVIKSLEEMVKPTEDHDKFISERQELLKKHASKDEHGDPIVQVNMVRGQRRETFQIPGIAKADNPFNIEIDKLKKKFKKELDEQETKEKEYQKHLEEEAEDFTPIMVDFKMVPESGLSQEAMDGAFFMIKPEEQPVKAKSKPEKKP